MPIATIGGLAFSLSMDAFASSIGKGAALHPGDRRLRSALRISAVFGLCELVTPAIGWMLGLAFAGAIAAVDHWIAFVLLGLVGARMIANAITGEGQVPRAMTLGALVLAGVATSIDATAVGVTLSFMPIDIVAACLVIGAVTFGMSLTGVYLGRGAGVMFGRWAEAAGGCGLILVGTKILAEHLGAF